MEACLIEQRRFAEIVSCLVVTVKRGPALAGLIKVSGWLSVTALIWATNQIFDSLSLVRIRNHSQSGRTSSYEQSVDLNHA